jgi:DNA-binding CsgD family transcriptional regulator
MTGMFLYWLTSKKKSLKNQAECVRLRKFMISTFFIGLISFFTFYTQYIMFLQPANTAYRILDYLFWVCFIFYWIDYLDSVVDGVFLHKFKTVVKYGCLGYIVIWIFSAAHIWDIDFTIANLSGRMLFVMLDILFCLLSMLVVVIYVIRGQIQVESRLSGFYIYAVSMALMVYAVWQFMHYIELFSGLSTPRAWELNPLNATAFFLFFSNFVTLIYVYHNDFASLFLSEGEGAQAAQTAQAAVEPEQPPMLANIVSECNLTPREIEVMEYVFKGFNNAEIADELYISQNTVKHHIYNLFKKLSVTSRVELICLLQGYYS